MNVQARDTSQPQRLGRYRLIAALGQGGMGMIHLAVAEGIGGFRKLFVIKELKRELAENQQFLGLFMREVKLAARLGHPNVVHTVEADQDAGRYFMAMEFLDGRPFSELLRRAAQPPVAPLELRLQVICQALTGLHHAHELTDYDGRPLHVVHRDVSPANIFVTYDGQVKVLDFGVAAAANSVESSDPPVFKGKIGYAAPEQLRLQGTDRRTDVFGCGVVLWEAIALRQLVRGRPSRHVFESRLLGTEPRIAQLLDDVDPQLASICDRATCTDPEYRYPSAEAFRRDLQAFLSERDLSVEPSQLGAFMRTKFAHERDSLHRLIEVQLGEEGETTSAVLSRGAGAFEREHAADRAEQTAAGALQSVRPAAASTRRLHARLLLGLGAAALLGVAAWQVRDGATRRPPDPGPRPARAEPAAQPADGSQRAKAASEAEHSEPAPRPTSSQAELPRSRSSSARATADAAEDTRRGSTGKSDADAALLAPTDAPSRAPRQAERTVPTVEEPDLDVDLRSLPRGPRRALDLENPFR